MVDCLADEELRYQEVAVYKIQRQFGSDFVYHNASGNLAISKEVLAEFRR